MISYFPSASGLNSVVKKGDIFCIASGWRTGSSHYSNGHILSMQSLSAGTISALSGCTYAYLPECTTILTGFANSLLEEISIPKCTRIGPQVFESCSNLTKINAPMCATINSSAFIGCNNLQTISFPKLQTLSGYDFFSGCTKLQSIYLMGSSVCTLTHSMGFRNSPITVSSYLGYFGSIYVPSSLLTTYKTATYWSQISSRIVGI